MELSIAELFLKTKEIFYQQIALLMEKSHYQEKMIMRMQFEMDFLKKYLLKNQKKLELEYNNWLKEQNSKDDFNEEEDIPF